MRLTFLDVISAVMDRPTRPLDFAIVLHFSEPLDLADLEAGAISARLQYPSTSALLDGTVWRSTPTVAAGIRCETVARSDAPGVMTPFVDDAWDLRRTPAVRQLAISFSDAGGAALLTRFHHAVCDALGGLLWLQHQLEVATAVRLPMTAPAPYAPPALRRHAAAKRRSAFAFPGPADRLLVEAVRASHRRRWLTVPIEIAPLQRVVRRAGGFTYNDLLAASALETFRLWNARNGRREPAVGLWVPINIREDPLAGFGNGSSRVRVYNRYPPSARLDEKSRRVRLQMDWSRSHGEWSIPEPRAWSRLPIRILRPLLRAYFNRPWVDMATGTFSHVERSPLDERVFANVSSVELVGLLDKRHSLGLFAVSRAGVTYVTFVHDPAQLDEPAVSRLASTFQEQLSMAIAESRS